MSARTGFLVSVVILVSACAPVKLIEPTRVSIGDTLSVEPQIRWASMPARAGMEMWTVDGASLDAITFVKGVADGEPIYRGPIGGAPEEDKRPKFRTAMTPTEIAELFVDSFALFRVQKLEMTGLRPAKFGTEDGFRFEVTWVTPAGLEMEGLVAGAIVKRRLHAVIYSGARAHFFPRYRDTVEKLLSSIKLQ